MGRPSKLTDELVATLEGVFSRGQTSIETACDYVGISRSTYFRWMSETDAKYLDFQDTMKRARATAVQGYLDVIHNAAQNGTWQAAAWWLERVLPDEYGRKTTVETISTDHLEREVQRLEDQLRENDL